MILNYTLPRTKVGVALPPCFRCLLLRLWFEARGPVHFPATMTANIFRGALGNALPRSLFAPLTASGPSGLGNPPRPFILRARHLDGRTLSSGERVRLDVHLFSPIHAEIVRAFRRCSPLHGLLPLAGASPEEVLRFPLTPLEEEPREATVHFLTPTELKSDSGVAPRPEFPILFARAAGRLRTLASLYASPLALDFDRLEELSKAVQLTSHSLTQEFSQRRSTRTGQNHPLGGFTGLAHYSGPLRELLPILNAAAFTGIGRQTVWGKGEFVLKR